MQQLHALVLSCRQNQREDSVRWLANKKLLNLSFNANLSRIPLNFAYWTLLIFSILESFKWLLRILSKRL